MKNILDFVSRIFAFLKKEQPNLEQAATLILQVISIAGPIVAQIKTAAPNKTLAEVQALYAKHGADVQHLVDDPTLLGNALLNLATSVVATALPGIDTNLIHAGIELALETLKGKAA